MPTSDRFLYALVSPLYYESLDRYQSNDAHYTAYVASALPPDWKRSRHDIWAKCEPPNASHPVTGWKIHISASLADAPAILASSIPILVAANVAFKYCCDGFILRLQSSKRWPRGKAGKFITIYPSGEEQFVTLMDSLYDALRGYVGPYILSDRRYKDCSVLYYRYGGLQLNTSLTSSGSHLPVLGGPNGEVHFDVREPFVSFPTWVQDPFVPEKTGEAPDEDGRLADGRYEITEALSFSAAGGVYLAFDHNTGREVVIKEARPHTNIQRNGRDAVALLKKEHRILSLLAPAQIAPQPIQFFTEWEHAYLVQDLVPGQSLRYQSSQASIVIRTRVSREDIYQFFEQYKTLYSRIARAFATLHEDGIIFTDVSHYNVIVDDDMQSIRLIDFEGAHQIGIDNPTSLFTPGFTSTAALSGSSSTREDDCFGLGSLLMAGLMPINAISNVKPHPERTFVRSIVRDFDLPEELLSLIESLLSDDPTVRPTATQVADALDRCPAAPAHREALSPATPCSLALSEISSAILSTADYGRVDRLFPADSAVFSTNPLQIEHGACGVVLGLLAAGTEIPAAAETWMENRLSSLEPYPPGLYCGLSGVSWTFCTMGKDKRAVELLRHSLEHPLLFDSPGLYYGAAGVGLAGVFLADRLKSDEALAGAERIASELISSADRGPGGELSWATGDRQYYGLGYGSSGLSTFFLSLFALTNNQLYLETSRDALKYDLTHSIKTADGGMSWRIHSTHPTHSPYVKYGSSGVGMALLRYMHVSGDTFLDNLDLTEILELIIVEADRKYAIFPGHCFGLAGIGEFALDLYLFHQDERFLAIANKIASGIALFAINREGGIFFPGEELIRLSTDFGTGSAGILHFLARLQSPLLSSALTVDHLLLGRARPVGELCVADSSYMRG